MFRLEYRDVTMNFPAAKGAGTVTAISNVTFSICDGEVVSLIGPSGCGKSTLLNIGSGLYVASRGQTFVDGEQVRRTKRARSLHAAKGPLAALAHNS